MRTWMGAWVVVAAAVFCMAWGGYVEGATKTTSPPPAVTPPAKPTWIVVEVMNYKGDITYETMEPKGMHDRVKKLHDDYLKALETWKKDKMLAEIKKEPFTVKKPVEGYVKKVDTTPATYQYQELATAEAAQLTKALKDKQAGK